MRPPFTWIIVGAVVVVGVFAALDVLRSSGEAPLPAEATATPATTTRRGTDPELESSSELQEGRLLRLIPGRVTSSFFSEMAVRFTVPPGWYGYQDNGVIVLGKALSPAAMGVNFRSGGIVVAAPPPSLVGSFARATRSLESTPGILVRDVSAVRIGGHPGRRYSLMLRRSVSVQGLFGFAVSLDPGEPDIIVLRVRQRTVVIRRGFDEDQERPVIERVIQSFRFLPNADRGRQRPAAAGRRRHLRPRVP
jgi:hypothetical protein